VVLVAIVAVRRGGIKEGNGRAGKEENNGIKNKKEKQRNEKKLWRR
jgi:hypothetical protein